MAGASHPRRILLCGYYGEHNLGDDALLEVLLQQLPAGCNPVVTAHDQAQVQQRFGVETVPRRRLAAVLAALAGCQGLVLGGGSLLQDVTSFSSLLYYAALIVAARLQAKPVVLWGQGLGPLRRRRSRLLVRGLLPWLQAVRWRDPESAALAVRLGRPGHHDHDYGADPVWASPSQPWHGQGGPIVVCWRPTPHLHGQAWSPYLKALSQLAVEADREVLWLPFHAEQDRDLLLVLSQQQLVPAPLLARSRSVQAHTPSEAKAVFAGAGLVIAMRLHGLILAAAGGAPCVALSYDPKVEVAALALGCPCQRLEVPASTAELVQAWQAQLEQPPNPQRLSELRDQALSHKQLLASALEHH